MKRLIAVFLIAALSALCLASCSSGSGDSSKDPAEKEATSSSSQSASEANINTMKIASMKGPTSIGLAQMMQTTSADFHVVATADEITPLLLKGDVDIACIPANLAATLYQKTDGKVRVLGINTLGVLNVATQDPTITSIDDLRGRTVFMTGKGTVPEYTLAGVLEAFGLTVNDIDLQFRTEPAEVAAMINQDETAVGILPQPYATAVTLKNPNVRIAIDLTEAWSQATQGGQLVTGVTVAMVDFVDSNADLIESFLKADYSSAQVAQNDPSSIAQTVVDLGIIDNLQLAEAAIPNCNVVCMTGPEMYKTLESYLKMLYEQNPESVGGSLPGDGFYYNAS